MIRRGTLGLVFALGGRDLALALKPCPSDTLEYALRNKDFVLIGVTVKIGKGPAGLIARNAKINNISQETGYSALVTIEVEEVIVADGKHSGLKKGDRFAACS